MEEDRQTILGDVMAEYIKSAQELGRLAYKAGKKKFAASDPGLRSLLSKNSFSDDLPALRAWNYGWESEHTRVRMEDRRFLKKTPRMESIREVLFNKGEWEISRDQQGGVYISNGVVEDRPYMDENGNVVFNKNYKIPFLIQSKVEEFLGKKEERVITEERIYNNNKEK